MFIQCQWLIATLLWLVARTEADQILVINPFEMHSQCLLMTPYIEALARRGHQLTVIHAFELCKPIENVRFIRIMDDYEANTDIAEFLYSSTVSKWREAVSIRNYMIKASLNILQNVEVQALLRSNATFDMVVVEPGFTDVMFAFSTHFNASLVGLATCGADWNLNNLMGHDSSPLLEPMLPLGLKAVDSLWSRIYNFYYISEEWLLMQLVFLPKQRQLHDHFFGHLDQSFSEIRQNFALILLNQHFSLFAARPSVPGMIEVAGMHVPLEDPPLTADLKLFIDEAPHGVIYFSLGFDLQTKDLPRETVQMLMDTFEAMPQRVIWKFESNPSAKISGNIYMGGLLPQQAILAHPNVKLFICHGGMLSIIEAAYYAKPVLGFPLFYDQFRNIDRLVVEGAAHILDINAVDREELAETIQRMIKQPEYQQNALFVSKRFRDQPMPPLETAIYWTEYVLRYKGARHMRVSTSHIKLIDYYCLDKLLMIFLRLSFVVGVVFAALSKWTHALDWLTKMALRLQGIQRAA
ncbi:UDP-glucuronosyltransferase [Drosophila pseudoobscura]|uniref:UDP-glucuronosyltransferase n=1 Tax=Drosophila pseudoobscura pseudoobscura TaxID=46245 RepID=A0A6I8USE8_DROPS|nr:UDP-glucuronosyltransferase [Drosophila pseudoobscura]